MGVAAGAYLAAGLMAVAEGEAPAGTWQVVYKGAFTDKVPKEWSTLNGEATVADGALVLKAAEDSDAQIMLTTPKTPDSVKVEFDCVLTGAKPSDISTFLNGAGEGPDSAYLLQFGGQANTQNRLRKEGAIVESTATDKPKIEVGKKYHVVAQNDGGKVSLTLDGKEIFNYTDSSPLKGAGHGVVGFYTYACTLKITDLVVSKKDAPAK